MNRPTFHLWLEPEGELGERLRDAILRIGETHGGPAFEPHMTLLPLLSGTQEELEQTASALAATVPPVELELLQPDYSDTYFQCVFLRIAETQGLLAARAAASGMFGHGEGPFMPHLSLLYGDHPQAERASIAGSIDRTLGNQRFVARRVVLIRAYSEDPADWHRIASPAFSG